MYFASLIYRRKKPSSYHKLIVRSNLTGYMYILECADGSLYTGSTSDLEKRLWEHQNSIDANYTQKRLPVKLIYYEEYSRIDDAFYREKQVQGWSRQKKLALIGGNYDLLPAMARKIFRKS